MKAVTLQQPWASAIAWGFKKFETRSWHPHWRGELAIHAGLEMPDAGERLLSWLGPKFTLAGMTELELPRGAIVAVCEIAWVRATQDVLREIRGTHDEMLGNYREWRYAWKLHNVRRLEVPIEARGLQQMWNVPRELAERVRASAFVQA